jgi:hypothetical protein
MSQFRHPLTSPHTQLQGAHSHNCAKTGCGSVVTSARARPSTMDDIGGLDVVCCDDGTQRPGLRAYKVGDMEPVLLLPLTDPNIASLLEPLCLKWITLPHDTKNQKAKPKARPSVYQIKIPNHQPQPCLSSEPPAMSRSASRCRNLPPASRASSTAVSPLLLQLRCLRR